MGEPIIMQDAPAESAGQPIALDAEAAAKACGISARTLWGLTAPRGPIPVSHVGRRRLYIVEDLKDYLRSQQIRPAAGVR